MAALNDLMIRWFGAITKDSNDNDAGRVVVSDIPANAESLYYADQFSNSITAKGETPSLTSLAIPYDKLIFTHSAAVAGVINVQATVNTMVINIVSLASGTIAITGEDSNGNALGTVNVVNSSGTIVSAATLGVGIYYLYLGK